LWMMAAPTLLLASYRKFQRRMLIPLSQVGQYVV
jgi:hypothetical protein